jgi:hypothetical protein
LAAAGLDSLAVRLVWIGDQRVYFNAGEVSGITPGWRVYLPSAVTGNSNGCWGAIDQVYPDLSSAPWDTSLISKRVLSPDSPQVLLFPPEPKTLRIPHLRVGLVNDGQAVDDASDLLQFPPPASLLWPWTRGVDSTASVQDGLFASRQTADGRRWAISLDTLARPEGEFPHSWGALADRLTSITEQHDRLDCPAVWALRPQEDDPLRREGVFFEGFSYIDDTTVGLEYATPFYTFAEYANSGSWRRTLAAAAHADAELDIRPPGWTLYGNQTWVRTTAAAVGDLPVMIDTVTVESFADYKNQRLALELEELDVCAISIDDVLRGLPSPDKYHVVSSVQNALVVFGVNQRKDDLNANLLTTAVCCLVDKLSLVRALLADQGQVTHTILALDDSLGQPHYPYDPRRGGDLLINKRLRRTLNFYVDRRIDRGMMVAEYIAGKLAAEGIKTRLVPAGPEHFAAADYCRDMDLFIYLWPVCALRPDQSLYPFLYGPTLPCGTNPLGLDQPEFLTLLEAARRESAALLRQRYYREIEYRLLAEPYICPLYRPIRKIVAANHLPEIRLTADGELDMFPVGGK